MVFAAQVSHMLVTGASGLLGANFVVAAGERYRVTACFWRHSFIWPGVEACAVDLGRDADTASVLDLRRPQIIMHFAAATNVDRCEEHPEEALALNAQVTERLARWAAAHGAVFVLMSTDSVFDGRQGGYKETDAPNPINHYARSKLAAERAVRALGPEHLIIRANIYGWNAQAKSSLAEWVLGRLETGQAVPGFTDAFFAPLLVNTLADIILSLLERGARGTVHVASRDAVSKHDFAVAIADEFGLSRHLIVPSLLAHAAMKGPRPPNTVLNCDRLRDEFRLSTPTVCDDLVRFKGLRETGFTAKLKAATSISQ